MTVVTTTAESPYHYTESGLDNVRLIGIKVRRCTKCSAEAPELRDLPGLHQVIATCLATADRSLGEREVLFLLKYAAVQIAPIAKNKDALSALARLTKNVTAGGLAPGMLPHIEASIRSVVLVLVQANHEKVALRRLESVGRAPSGPQTMRIRQARGRRPWQPDQLAG